VGELADGQEQRAEMWIRNVEAAQGQAKAKAHHNERPAPLRQGTTTGTQTHVPEAMMRDSVVTSVVTTDVI
jgi:hypothetical protein